MFEKLRDSIQKLSRLGIVDAEHVEELVRDMQRTLLSSDVDVALVMQLSDRIKNRCMEKLPEGLSRKEHVIKVVYDELTSILGNEKSETSLKPKRILLAGLYGTGKTSTAAKLARFYQKKGLKTALVCCDVDRPAAYEQLKQLAEKIDAPFYGENGNKDASAILREALVRMDADVIIVDSSGRNALDDTLIREIKGLNDTMTPEEKILVIPADIGQAAKIQARAFHDALGITDIIVTKTDATAKGGGAITACYETGAKVKFITTGEGIESLEQYDPRKFVGRIIGFADMETLLEKASTAMDEKKAEKVMSGNFDIEEFYSQFESIKKMGSFSQILDMMGLGKMKGKVNIEGQEEKIRKWRFVIDSMTPHEKKNPDVLDSSRIKRIAAGSGTPESDVRELLGNYSKAKKMMKTISPSKMKRGGMGGMLRKFGI
ncbi:MAG: signal recognition particle protein [Candidatus Aenigmarchaeota archaeon]|nr:signal recognition particle protein [Candidatus Aenigmarchaeota archaeon]